VEDLMAREKAAAKKRGPGRPPGPYVPLAEIGSTGLKRFSGYVFEEFLPVLQGRRGMRVYREMRDNSAVVGACLGAIENLIRQVRWYVKPFSQDTEDLARADVISTSLHDMSFSWAETLVEILTMLPYGFSYVEIVYKRRLGESNDPARRSKYSDGLIAWRKLALRAQETVLNWDFDDEGGIRAMNQQAPPDYNLRKIPIEKALLFRAKSEKNNPEGRSILRNAYFAWYFSKKLCAIEGIGVERDLAGLPIGWIPVECFDSNATPEQKATKAAMEKIVRNIRRDEEEGLCLPLDYQPGSSNKRFDLTLLSSGGKRNYDTSSIIERYDRRIAMTMFQDLVLMGQPNTIQYKGGNMPELFAIALGGVLDSVTDVINAHGIPRVARLNGWPADRCPQLAHGDVQVPNLAALGDYVSKLVAAGMPIFPSDWTHLRRVAGVPEPPEGELPAAPAAADPAGGPDNPAGPDDTDLAPEGRAGTDGGDVTYPTGKGQAADLAKRLKDSRPLGIGEFAQLTGWSRDLVRKWLDTKVLKSTRPGGKGHRKITAVEATRFCEEQGLLPE
jgi:hypothetical protein